MAALKISKATWKFTEDGKHATVVIRNTCGSARVFCIPVPSCRRLMLRWRMGGNGEPCDVHLETHFHGLKKNPTGGTDA